MISPMSGPHDTEHDDGLAAEDVLRRREAALEVAMNARRSDAERIRQRLVRGVESDLITRSRLSQALRKAEADGAEGMIADLAGAEDVDPELSARALSETTDRFLHELSPILAAIKRAVRDELGAAAPGGPIDAAIQRFESFLTAMEGLRDASEQSPTESFNLVELIDAVIAECRDTRVDVEILSVRRDPLAVVGNPHKLRLALRNGIKNAMEASPEKGEVVVSCGETEREWWISVLDDGPGIPKGSDQIWIPGRSLKPKGEHRGFGLPIARQAIESMNGVVELNNRSATGTEFRLRWPKG